MDLRHMRQFIAVAEELHFGRAARRLNIAQPPLSQAIRRLEANLGFDLFDRSRRGVELTEAGRIFLVEARRTLTQAEVARKMAARAAVKTPELRVAFIGPALYQILPNLLIRVRTEMPDMHVRLFERSSHEQIAGIVGGDFDIGFITAGIAHPECESMIVERAPLVGAVPANSPLAAYESVGLAELAEQPFILPPQNLAAQTDALNVFKTAGIVPHVTQIATQTNTMLSLIGAGVGCSLAIVTAALSRPCNVKFLPIEDMAPSMRWEMAAAWHPERLNKLSSRFLQVTKEHIDSNPQFLDPDWRRFLSD